MTEASLTLGTISNQAKPINKTWHKSQSWWSFTAFLCLAGGISFVTIGLFMSGVGYFVSRSGIDSKIGTTLIVTVFPLMFFGAHALDKVSENEKKEKRRKLTIK